MSGLEVEGNASRRADEIEALSSIYGDEWCVIDDVASIYCIRISESLDNPKWTINLQVHMPKDYPLQAPPQYQINACWLRGNERINIEDRLSQIYFDNVGEDLIFLWVEAIREILQEKTDATGLVLDMPQSSGRTVVHSTEVEDADDDFDPSSLGEFSYEAFEAKAKSLPSASCPDITHGNPVTEKKSTFQPHLAIVKTTEEVNQVMSELYKNKKIANATHNILAYRLVSETGATNQGCDDDGETHAGSRMLHLLQILDVQNVMVVVSRWYGGILLGPDRFKHINNCTRQILEENGFSREKGDKRRPKNSDKKAR